MEEPEREGDTDHKAEIGEELKRYRKAPYEAALSSDVEGRVEERGKEEMKRPEKKSER